MVYPRETLNRLKWDSAESLEEAVITYVNRGAPDDVTIIRGSEILELEKWCFVTRDASIPYHRVVRIEYRGETVFDKKRERGG